MSQSLHHQIIARAHQLIEDPAHWMSGWDAGFKNGNVCDPWHKRAHAFCGSGALMRAAYELTGSTTEAEDLAEHIENELLALLPGPSSAYQAGALDGLIMINDVRGHAAVLKLFQKALAS
jgi:hypothetical protein